MADNIPGNTSYREAAPVPLSEDAKYMLGEINATVKNTSLQVADLRIEMMSNLSGFNTRLIELERNFAHRQGAVQSITWIVGIASAFIGSLVSGLLTFFIGKH